MTKFYDFSGLLVHGAEFTLDDLLAAWQGDITVIATMTRFGVIPTVLAAELHEYLVEYNFTLRHHGYQSQRPGRFRCFDATIYDGATNDIVVNAIESSLKRLIEDRNNYEVL